MKRSFTLLEVIIATVLIGFLCTGLFQLFYQTLRIQAEGERAREHIFQLSLFEHNSKHLFDHISHLSSIVHPESKYPALAFRFDSFVDPEEEFCGRLNGVLYLSEQGELTLSIISTKQKQRKTIFLDHLQMIRFHYFSAKTGKWQEEWFASGEEIPDSIEIDLEYPQKTVSMLFFLPSSFSPILLVKGP